MKRLLILLVMLGCATESDAAWVRWGNTSYYLWVDAGQHDGWWYTRGGDGWSGYRYFRHSRTRAVAEVLVTNAWRDSVVAILANRQASRARLEEAAYDHASFIDTIRAAGLTVSEMNLTLPGYGGALAVQKGQSTVYGYAPIVGDGFRNLDVEARLLALQRLDEQVAAGHLQISQETRKTIRDAIASYERLKALELKMHALDKLLPHDAPQAGKGELAIPKVLTTAEATDYVRTIVAAKCVRCHQPGGAHEALDLRDLSGLDEKWEDVILDRITTRDLNRRMPKGSTLFPDEIRAFHKAALCRKAEAVPPPQNGNTPPPEPKP